MQIRPLISVIIPVYAAQAYLDRCVDSVVKQIYQNLEIILVDDGSPDNCPAMCDAWAEKDSRIRVIHQENHGGGAARNAALDIANGSLISFVDSDDYIAPDMYEHLWELLLQGADIVECGYMNVADDDVTFPQTKFAVRVYTGQEAMAEHISDQSFRQLIWNKIYRREVIGDVRFPEGKGIDDEFFTYQVIGNANMLLRSDKICYAYRQQENSVMHTLTPEQRIRGVQARAMRQRYINTHFPELAGASLKALWFTGMYQGQCILRERDQKSNRTYLRDIAKILSDFPAHIGGCSFKDGMWLVMAKISLMGTCRLRNILKIGL